MTTSSNNTESKTNDPTPAKTTTDPGSGYSDPNKVEADKVDPTPAGPEFDNNGYEITPDPEKKPEVDPEPAKDPEKKEDPSTGYSKDQVDPEPAKDPEKKPEVDPEADPKKDEDKLKEEINTALGDYADKELISEFAIKNNMTKEQVEAYVTLMKAEDSKFAEEKETQRVAQRSSWKKELMDDNSFGGDNFDINVDRVEKVLTNFMPNTKKVLTERGSMLPPYIMRDLLSVSKALNPNTKLVNGDPSKPVEKEDGNFLDNMYE